MPDIEIIIDRKIVAKDMGIEIKRIVYKHIPTIQSTLNNQISSIVRNRLSIGIPVISGQDFYEMGIPDINSRMMSILDVAAKSMQVNISLGNLLKIDIGILKQDYSDLLSLPESVFTYISNAGSGVLEWLRWLLTEGDASIVSGFEFSLNKTPFSRTGGGVMIKGSSWKVPESLSGTAQNNILTRALHNIEKDIEAIVKKELQRIIR